MEEEVTPNSTTQVLVLLLAHRICVDFHLISILSHLSAGGFPTDTAGGIFLLGGERHCDL